MEVEGVRVQVLPIIQSGTGVPTEPPVEETAQEPPQSSGTTEPETTEQAESNSDEMAGVIRNLLEGHFKGVADVRLRINHFEQLAQIASENLKAAAEAEVVNVLDVVGSGIDNLPEPGESFTAEAASGGETEPEPETVTVAGLHQEFDDTVNQSNGEFQSAQTPLADDLIAGIEDAFLVFIGALQDLLVPPAEDNASADEEIVTTTNETQETPVTETGNQIGGESTETQPPLISETEPTGVETPPDDEPQATESTEPGYQDILDEIINAFDAALIKLTEALNNIQTLPDLSEPSGNGGAYEKFLAIYNELWGIDAEKENTESSGIVDMTA